MSLKVIGFIYIMADEEILSLRKLGRPLNDELCLANGYKIEVKFLTFERPA